MDGLTERDVALRSADWRAATLWPSVGADSIVTRSASMQTDSPALIGAISVSTLSLL
jgi:hypothetical protein